MKSARSQETGARGPRLVVLALGVTLALIVLAFSYVEIVDDAYISYRYAHYLAEGEGLVFNDGERVEGYTNLLWTLLMALPAVFEIPVHLFAAYLGVTFGVLALFLSWRSCRLLGLSTWATAAAVLTLGAYPDFWMTSAMGLEGGLFALLLTLSVFLALSAKPTRAGICGGLLFAVRPESILAFPAFALYAFLGATGNRNRKAFSLVVPWLGIAAMVTLWRLYYYGAWLPNTITAKSVPDYAMNFETLWGNALEGLSYCTGFLWSAGPLTLGALLGTILGRRRLAVWLCLGTLLPQVLVVLLNGGDWMLNHRLLATYAPLLCVLLGVAVDHLRAAVPRVTRFAQIATVITLVVWCLFIPRDHWWDMTPDAEVGEGMPCWEIVSKAAQPTLRPSDVVAPEALGYFSYVNPKVYSHDLWGLTDRHIAIHGTYYEPQFGKGDGAYTYQEIRPDLIVAHTGTRGFLRLIADAAGPAYDKQYRTYLLSKRLNEADSCRHLPFAIAIRKEQVPRFLPAFQKFEPRPIEVAEKG